MTSTITNTGETVEIPEHCPPWCSGDHAAYCEDFQGRLTAEEIRTHAGYQVANGILDEIRDPFRVEDVLRAGGGAWDLGVELKPQWPGNPRGPEGGRALMHLRVHDFNDADNRSLLVMTTGELRVMAAHAIALCDLVDGIGGTA